MTRRALELPAAAFLAVSLLSRGEAAAGSALPDLARSARSHALGDGGALLSGVHALGENPAALATGSPELLSQFQRLPLDTFFSALGFAQPLGTSGGTLAPSYATLRSGSFDGRDASGRRTGEFSHEEHLVGLHGAFKVEQLSVGAGLKRFELRVGSFRSRAYGADVGARYRLEDAPVSLAVCAINLGAGGEQDAALPRRLVVAAAGEVAGAVSLAASYGYRPLDRTGDLSLGTELRLGPAFALRARYSVAAGVEAGAQGVAAGIGFNPVPSLAFDYGFDPLPRAVRAAGEAGTHRVTLSYRFAAAERPVERKRQRPYWDQYWRVGGQ